MKKAKFFGSYIFATGYSFRGVAVAALAGVMCLVGPAIDKTFAEDENDIFKRRPFPSGTSSFPGERRSHPGTGSFPSERPAISFEISDEELTGNMDKYLARKASVNKYLAWKASVNEYLAWKASVSEYLAWKTSVNEYLAHKASVNEYLAWKASVNEYLAWKEEVSEKNASSSSKVSDEEILLKKKKQALAKKSQDSKQDDQNGSDLMGSGAGLAIQVSLESSFLRGDASQDGQVNMQDATVILKWLFGAGYKPACVESADVNNDGRVQLDDAIQILNYATQGMAPPAKPFPACGLDPKKGGQLGCNAYIACSSVPFKATGK